MNNSVEEYPSLVDRIKSTFIDTVVIIVAMFICSHALDGLPDAAGWMRAVCFVAVFLLYDPLCTAFGCTVGNYFMKIRVRQNEDHNKRINFSSALIRYIVKALLGWVSFLTIHSNAEKRAVHDMAAGSIMVNLTTNTIALQTSNN
ncbi:RDD family protein [Parapedobacter tibetensis]|uniref:RDD family protein n=1 Tax=Parapedobacter tibetensis TaxID=2972951 RepID=UPI00214D97A2|nr:RDD family protein [Parapedobacter tibetensis]